MSTDPLSNRGITVVYTNYRMNCIASRNINWEVPATNSHCREQVEITSGHLQDIVAWRARRNIYFKTIYNQSTE